MAIRDLINKFTSGELDPKMLAEVDYEGYRKGARKLRNVMSLPQGAVQRRFGTVFEATFIDFLTLNPVQNPDYLSLFAHEIDGVKYWFVILGSSDGSNENVSLLIYLEGVLLQTIATLGAYLIAEIQDIRWVLDYNSVYLLHPNHAPRIVQGVAGVFTDNVLIFSAYPTEDFSYIDAPLSNYTNNGVTFSPNAVAATTLTATIAVFTSNHAGVGGQAGGIFVGNGGVFRIYSVNAAGLVATGVTLTDFIDTTAVLGQESLLRERRWGDGAIIGGAPVGVARGYPSHGGFFQGRLVLGGSPFSPGGASASVVKGYFNFDDTDSDASTGWSVEAGDSGNDAITDILASKSLVLLTAKGSSSTNILVDTPTTPTNVFLNTQGREPSRNMDGVILDNYIFYADNAGNTIWAMTYDVPDSGYTISNASILSSHLIRNPRWSDVYDPSAVDGRYLLVVNSDGTMAIFNSISAENIKAWTLAETVGSFIDVATVNNDARVLVKRKVGTGNIINGEVQAFYTVDTTFNAFVPLFQQNPYGSGPIFTQDGDYILVGNEQAFSRLGVLCSIFASSNIGITAEYLANTGNWNELTSFTDSTNGLTANGIIAWDVVADTPNWTAQTIAQTYEGNNELKVYYWIRIRRTTETVATTPYLIFFGTNLADNINLEKVTFDTYMDNVVSVTGRSALATGVITGLTNLAGQYAFAFAGGFPIGRFYVDADGEVDLGVEAFNRNVEIGLDYKVNVTPMPIVGMFQNGYSVYDDMHVDKVYIDYFRTLGLTVQAQVTPEVVPGVYLTDETPYPQTGYSKIPSFNGWDPRVEFVISQSYPAPMTLLAVSYTVEVNP